MGEMRVGPFLRVDREVQSTKKKGGSVGEREAPRALSKSFCMIRRKYGKYGVESWFFESCPKRSFSTRN